MAVGWPAGAFRDGETSSRLSHLHGDPTGFQPSAIAIKHTMGRMCRLGATERYGLL